MTQSGTEDNGPEAEFAALRLEGLCHLNRLQSGSATDIDELQFRIWRKRSSLHEEAFRSAVQLQRLVRAVERERGAQGEDSSDQSAQVIAFRRPPIAPVTRRWFLGSGIAASIAAGAYVGGTSLELVPSPRELSADVRTGTGESRMVRLADGGSVNLNTRTSISLRARSDVPAVDLINGEVVLQTGRSGSAALFADSGQSVGRNGRFSARRTDAEVCITCIDGTVAVAWQNGLRLLEPGEQVRYGAAGLGGIVQTDPKLLTAWQNGVLIFRDKPMREVVAEINRYRAGKVILANDRTAERRLSGTYYVSRLDEFFSQVELALDVKVTRYPAGIVVLA